MRATQSIGLLIDEDWLVFLAFNASSRSLLVLSCDATKVLLSKFSSKHVARVLTVYLEADPK